MRPKFKDTQLFCVFCRKKLKWVTNDGKRLICPVCKLPIYNTSMEDEYN